MKIAYFTDTFMPELNGVTNTLAKLRGFLEKRGIGSAFFAPAYDGKAAGQGVRLDSQGVYRFGGLKTAFSPESRLAFPRAREIGGLCDTFKPDLVHVITELGIGRQGLKYARSRGLPLVMSYHTDYGRYLHYFHLDFLKPLVERYLAHFYRFAHRILAPSKYTLEELFRRQYRNLGLWSRGIDTGRFSPRFRSGGLRKKLGVDDRFVFLYVGRLSPEKGIDTLLYSIETMRGRFPGKTAFIFTGGGPWEKTIRRRGFDNVILTGFKSGPELSRIYASSDCFVFPSGTETFGNAPLEAMASGLPVAGINSGGVTDFLIHGHNSLLCAAGDGAAFTEHLAALMVNGELRRTLAKNGLAQARSRDWDRIFEDLLAVYAGTIQKTRDRYWKYAS